jgi:predicted metalloendopeptidase
MKYRKVRRSLVVTGCAALLAAGAAGAAAPLRSGVDKSNFDPAVRPQDDLYRAIDGRWLQRTAIPADLSNYGAFTALTVEAEQRVHELLEKARANPTQVTPQARKAADLYASFMDEQVIEARGLAPLQPELARIDALQTPAEVVAWLGRSQTLGVSTPIQWYVQPDPHDATVYLPGLAQSGLSLPDRDYYLRDDGKYVTYRQQLRDYATTLLQLSGDPDPASGANAVMTIEQKLAQAQWTRVQNRDPVATTNRFDRAALAKAAPHVEWQRYFDGIGAQVPAVNVDQPPYLEALDAMISGIGAVDWRRYLRFHLLDAYAAYLPARFDAAHFEFHDKALSGTEQPRERWKRGVDLVNQAAGEISGQMYVEAYFPAAAKQRMQALVHNLLRAFNKSIDGLTWMTPPTRLQAKRKLAAISTKIGYPDKWRDYSALLIQADDVVGNVQRATLFEERRQLAQLGRPVDRSEWHMTPQTVNAYYNAQMNEIVFPAAILQPPFFDPSADDAVNYGGIGGVIGHEISHGFDDQGRQFDAQGNLRDWWTAEDARLFKQRTAALVAQYNACTVLDDQHVNGELTLGENIADLSGLAIAYKAYLLSLNGRKGRVIDGLTPGQRFFAGWAQVWRRNFRDDNRRMRLSVDPHSPDEFRVNVVASNLDAFHAAFGVKPGDKLYRPPAERIRIW